MSDRLLNGVYGLLIFGALAGLVGGNLAAETAMCAHHFTAAAQAALSGGLLMADVVLVGLVTAPAWF